MECISGYSRTNQFYHFLPSLCIFNTKTTDLWALHGVQGQVARKSHTWYGSSMQIQCLHENAGVEGPPSAFYQLWKFEMCNDHLFKVWQIICFSKSHKISYAKQRPCIKCIQNAQYAKLWTCLKVRGRLFGLRACQHRFGRKQKPWPG